ncbi:hypothetical protein [Burkholderia vietnamiensis]|uniref:hypothetical protein n=1 Tax=Burkholderia vietnamiensis TaxID=60552 RepID=UPI001D136766|nr:hypothetical protein [Burkholderia vietnamiensis]UEC01754.1 hypothetical protein LK462_06925 [Burkholderia vietnamiensis]
MLDWKDALRLLAILAAWGLAGHFDYEDALALEKANRAQSMQNCMESRIASPQHAASQIISVPYQDSEPPESERPCATDPY